MGKALLILTGISAVLYLLLASTSWYRGASGKESAREEAPKPSHAYFWGLAFAIVFYYGFPVWWWRYGLQNACKLVISCMLIVAATQAILRNAGLIEVDEFHEAVAFGLLISVPVRSLAGLWVAKNDKRWRNAIVTKRGARRCVVASDA